MKEDKFVTCSRCKQKEGRKVNKYYGGVFCDSCFKKIKNAVRNGKLPGFRMLKPKEQAVK